MEQSSIHGVDQQERQMDADLNWLAGIWEGEGWFSINKGTRNSYLYYRINCGMTNTDQLMIETVHSILSQSGIPHWISGPKRSGIGQKWKKDIIVGGMKRVEKFLLILTPYLRTKKDRAMLLLDFIESRNSGKPKATYTNYQHELYGQIRSLNGRHPSVSSESIRQPL